MSEYVVRALMRRQLGSDFEVLWPLIRATFGCDAQAARHASRNLLEFATMAVAGIFRGRELEVCMCACMCMLPFPTVLLYELSLTPDIVVPTSVREALERRVIDDVRSKCHARDIAGQELRVIRLQPSDLLTSTIRLAAE